MRPVHATRRRLSEAPVADDEQSRNAYVNYLEVLAAKWSSATAASLVNASLLSYLQPRFHRCSTPIKVKIVLSFLYLKDSVRIENRSALLAVLAEAEVDRDEWVKKLSRLVSSFVLVGSIDVRETDSETAFHLLKFLETQREKHGLEYLNKPPLEAPHMANVLTEKVLRCKLFDSSADGSEEEQAFQDFLTKSEVLTDNVNFNPKMNFLSFNAELMRPGELAMRRALKRHNQGGGAAGS